MAPTIRVDEEVFKALQRRAQPFVDTPNDVLRRLLGLNGRRGGAVTPRKTRPRYAPGAVTPGRALRRPILHALADLGGRGEAVEVLRRVESQMASQLTPLDRELLPSGGDLRWRKQANFERFRMVKEGLLSSGSPRGTWDLTEEGWQEARKQP